MTDFTLSKSGRVRQALAGRPVDRAPVSFWMHNYAEENSAETLAMETVARFQQFDWDFIKIQSRASCFAEDWGNRYRPSTERTVSPTLLSWPIKSAADLNTLRPLDPLAGVLGEQIEALKNVRAAVGPDIPIISTVFAPAMVLTYLVGESVDTMLTMVRNYPAEATKALQVISDTYADYSQACLEYGADGIFFAIKAASKGQMSRLEYQEFGLPFDAPVLSAAREGWLNMLHLCGEGLYFEIVDALPSPLLNWDIELGNPGLVEGMVRSKRCVIGGVSAKPRLQTLGPDDVVAQVNDALERTKGINIMIGPGCSIAPSTPDANLMAARQAVSGWWAHR